MVEQDKKEEYYKKIRDSYIEHLQKEMPELKNILKEESKTIVKETFSEFLIKGEVGVHTLTDAGLQRVINTATRDIAVKILQWYGKTKDEEFADFIGITRMKDGK